MTDYLYVVNSEEMLYPNQPKDYLTDWTNAGYLRKYPDNGDEFLFELAPATENGFKGLTVWKNLSLWVQIRD